MADQDKDEKAIIEWFNTFESGACCTVLADIRDGCVIADILREMVPTHFDVNSISRDAAENWALAGGNFRSILRTLHDYFTTVLIRHIDTCNINVNAIVKDTDFEEILKLLELVVGVAVMCEDKAVFIGNIFGLNTTSQKLLKGLVESVMTKATEIEESTLDTPSSTSSDILSGLSLEDTLRRTITSKDEELVRSTSMVEHLQQDRDKIITQVEGLKDKNEQLKNEVLKLRDQSHLQVRERAEAEQGDKVQGTLVTSLENANADLKKELEEVRRDFELSGLETLQLKQELRTASSRVEQGKENQARLEMELSQQADELDVAKDRASKLTKMEQTIEKYQTRLEEMVALKKQNKELSEKMDQYLDQIHDLESTNKGLSSMNRMVEQYKNKAVELEREKFELVSAKQMREHEVSQLTTDIEIATASRHKMEEELFDLRSQLEDANFAYAPRSAKKAPRSLPGSPALEGLSASLDDSYECDTVPSLRAKVRRLERELKRAQESLGGSDGTAAGADGVGAEGQSEGQGQQGEGHFASTMALLKEELEDVRAIKRDREEALIDASKRCQELDSELRKAKAAMSEQGPADKALKVSQKKLMETENTVRLLEETVKSLGTQVNKLEQEKDKLQSYTTRSLANFKEKYMGVLTDMRTKNKALESKMKVMEDKHVRNQENWVREERMVASNIYGLGVRMMDHTISRGKEHSIGADVGAGLGLGLGLGAAADKENQSTAGQSSSNQAYALRSSLDQYSPKESYVMSDNRRGSMSPCGQGLVGNDSASAVSSPLVERGTNGPPSSTL